MKTLVACNIYISAGLQHQRLLLDLFDQSLHRNASLVHVFCDTVYNRSSFHLAGEAMHVADLASDLAVHAVQELRTTTSDSQTHYHPFVGSVDHVSVFPLQGKDPAGSLSPSGRAAWSIGDRLSKKNVQVWYYGNVKSPFPPLAQVRREKTRFFQSGGLAETPEIERQEVATVGAPSEFVENYNIRLSCSKKVAQSLTKRVREKDGGLVGVEALTLPYSQNRWEVACNLLQPTVATTHDIDRVAKEWQQESNVPDDAVESYRVGTTAQQCLTVLQLTDEEREEYYKVLREKEKGYFD